MSQHTSNLLVDLAKVLEGGIDVLIVMGSQSDWQYNENGGAWKCASVLSELRVPNAAYIVSAHRTPERMYEVAERTDGKVKVVIAAAGGAAHLPGMMAALMLKTPVIGLPMKSSTLSGVDSLYSIVQMPQGVPVGTMAIGGAANAALFAATIVGLSKPEVTENVVAYRQRMADSVDYLPNNFVK